MSSPLLTTKLYFPPPPPKGVQRHRLIERLNEGLHYNRKLTLISAPAGFGKTSLVSEWLTGCDWQVAWLSLDEGDSDPVRFLTYLIAALQKIAPHIGDEVLGILQSPQPPPIETILTALINEIAIIQDNFLLVLDDYHVIDARQVDDALTFLLEHLPPQMRLVITTREDPQLPLARMRVRGQLNEFRANDLRFTTAECAEFLGVMGLNLSAENVAALEDRTEGWIAGLQLAALSMQDNQDVAGFIRAFAGDHRYIVDYLVEEVLHRQPEPVRNFLLQTSILDRLNASLCEAVTGQEQGQAQLEALERGNFFIVPLDDKRQWYRYHHLFADVLLAHLRTEQPEQIVILHRRASEWYEHNGSTANAIRHALAARDFERAATLAEIAVPEIRKNRQEATMLVWLKVLPDEIIRRRPVLSVHYAGILLANGELKGVETWLQDAERWLATGANEGEELLSSSSEMVVVDSEEFRNLPGLIAIYRAGSALATGDVARTVKYAGQALELLPEEDQLGRGAAAGLLGLVYWTVGDLDGAHRSYTDSMARLQKAGHISDVMGLAIALAEIQIAQGRLHEAMHTYEQALQLAMEQGMRGTADMYVGMSELYLEFNKLDTATQHLLRSQALGEFAGLPQNPYRWRVAMARIRQAQGDLDGALEMLHEAQRVYVGDFFPYVRPIAALKARIWVAQGRLSEALGWAREQGLSTGDDLSYLHEFEHITLARMLLAQARYSSARDRTEEATLVEAKGLLDRLLQAAEAGGRRRSLIEILVLLSLMHTAQGDMPAALGALERSLTMAEPDGFVRIFTDEGPPVAQLLQEAARHKIAPAYVRQLLSALGQAEEITPVKQVLIEPLSERELQVLRLLGSDLSGPEIAHQLMVSLNTLNTHIKNIYTKLGVNNRRAAVHRADELHLS
ncbi:MAG TPA: LuxR C-terminal-related transcriptional regulator [Chloroflexia bacterium]|nr:LuxR C-terminal-related transcriptional regulator [Chloroflexia bacterium]